MSPGMVDDDRDRISHEDDELRHWLADATVLDCEDREVYVVSADAPDEMEMKRRTRRAPRAQRFDR